MTIKWGKTTCGILLAVCLVLICAFFCIAYADQDFTVPGENYVLPDNNDYELSAATKTDTFFYGANSMGNLRITGSVGKVTKYNGTDAYGVSGPVSISYTYDGGYQLTDVEKWFVDNDGTGKVNSYGLGFLRGVGHGCIIIESSLDGENWVILQNPIMDYFTRAKKDTESLIYNISENEIKNGKYYRVIVAYRFCRRIVDGFWFFGDSYEYMKCIELYKFYVCSENNYVTFRDLGNGYTLQDQSSTESGFMIYKNGSNAKVTIEGRYLDCHDYELISEPGEYVVNVTTTLGYQYKSTITVTDGINFTPLDTSFYVEARSQGYTLRNKIPYTPFQESLTSLYLATPKGTGTKNVDSKYGITGKSVALYLQLNRNIDDLGLGWVVTSDRWGSNTTTETFYGTSIGEIGKGALIIQTSKDGKTWVSEEKGRYSNGLYTTDYATHYGKAENVLIYTPSGKDVISGTYYRVLFLYQIYNRSNNDYRDFVEKYEFYLCSNELNAVTFHNLTIADTLPADFADLDKNTIKVYQDAETLLSGSYTTTGFRVNISLNQSVEYSIKLNGEPVQNTDYGKTGRYDITLKSAVDDTKEVTLYVDRSTSEEAMQTYFGEGFITDKRIFSEGEYPVYESGETSYHVSEVSEKYIPLYGEIRNQTTGSVITIEQTPEAKTGVITEAGDYVAIFSTNRDYFSGSFAGDARVFTFRFGIIPEGTAPGPVINQELLKNYSHSTVTDSNPIYYGLTYSSAGKGNITLAFATEKEAIEYAYNYEKGMVEDQGNGRYRYTGSFIVDQKTKYDSAWDLTDAIYYFAREAVHKHYFDMSDEYTYLSLTPEILERTTNLRQLELPQSVTIFAEGQKDKLTDTDSLPILNDKPYAFLDPASGDVNRGCYSFKFLTDQYGGIDSKSVMITDCNGGKHAIRYSESVGKQLLENNCPSGIVTIREETKYGDFAEYQAIYIAPGENQAKITLAFTNNGMNESVSLENNNAELIHNVESFSIASLSDAVDSYSFVIVRNKQDEVILTTKEKTDIVWKNPGEYTIKCVNRLGYGFVFPIAVTSESDKTPEQDVSDSDNVAEVLHSIEPRIVEIVQTEEIKVTDSPAPTDQMQLDVVLDETDKGGNSTLWIIIGIIAGLATVAIVYVFINKKNNSSVEKK